MAITKKDIEKLTEHFATRKDLERFATKEDLERFATKEDLERFATKEDLKRFATKEDLKGFSTREDLMQLENKVVTRLDKVMGELEKAREDRVFAKAKDDEQDRRISSLETKLAGI